MYQIDNMPFVLQIAKQNEFGSAHQHQFDISEWLADYPAAAIGIALTRPGETDADAMPASTVISGNTMTWTVSAWETEIPGHSTIEARALTQDEDGNDVKVKSEIVRTFVVPSIAEGLPTDPLLPFIDQIIVYAGIANSSSNAASDEADRAHDERDLATEENRLAGVARTAAEGFASAAGIAKGLAEGYAGTASAAAGTAVSARNLAQQYRDSSSGYASTALGHKNDAETAQGLAEDARDLADGYVDLFTVAESGRVSAEQTRQSNEGGRTGAENLRVSAEGSRVIAEGARVIAETARGNAQIQSAAASGNSLVFTRINGTTLTAVNTLKAVNDATALAVEKAGLADTKAGLADSAASLANEKAGLADTKATLADGKATLADNAASNADISTGLANTATQNADTATGLANTATSNANTAKQNADTATQNANTKAGLADTAAQNADTKAGLANTAAQNANNNIISSAAFVGNDLVLTKADASTVTIVNGKVSLTGATGNGISSIARTSGTGAAGTTDTYTITYTSGSTATFTVLNGYIPQRGTDYWTGTDTAAMAADVDSSIQDALADYTTVNGSGAGSDTYACDVASKKAKNFALAITDPDAKTVTFQNIPAGRCEVFLEITTSAIGSVTWTLNGGVLAWVSGAAPTLASGKVYGILFATSNGGTNWRGYSSWGV